MGYWQTCGVTSFLGYGGVLFPGTRLRIYGAIIMPSGFMQNPFSFRLHASSPWLRFQRPPFEGAIFDPPRRFPTRIVGVWRNPAHPGDVGACCAAFHWLRIALQLAHGAFYRFSGLRPVTAAVHWLGISAAYCYCCVSFLAAN